MDLATLSGIIGALGALITAVPIIVGWLRRTGLKRREKAARVRDIYIDAVEHKRGGVTVIRTMHRGILHETTFTPVQSANTDTPRPEGIHGRILNHLPPEEQQFYVGFLEDGIEHRRSEGKPVLGFIVSETRSTALSIGKLRLFNLVSTFVRRYRRQVS